MLESLERATQSVGEEELSRMVLDKQDLHLELEGYQLAREGVLDNETMAAHGFPGSTTGETSATGRITGYLREFISSADPTVIQKGMDVIAATVVHLFHHKDEVSRWMTEKFLGDFKRYEGQELSEGQQLLSAEPLKFEGFSDLAVGLLTKQTSQTGPISSTIVDFRVGRLLGVAYLATLGDADRKQLVTKIGLALERKMVKVSLGSQ